MITWLASARAGEATVFRIGRDRDRLIAEWVGLATLSADRDGSNAAFASVPHAEPALLQKLETGTKRGLLRHLRGEVTLHAAAVENDDGAIAIVGDSGAGKSTLAFALADAPGHDFALLSDDCLCVDGLVALPSEAVGWLAPSGGGGKSPRSPARVATRPIALRAIVSLACGTELAVHRLHGARAAGVLAGAMIRFVLDEPEVHRADMDHVARLVHHVPIFELTRPPGLEHVDSTLARVRELSVALR